MRVTPPIIGRLLAVSRVMAHRRVVAGDFGEIFEGRGGAHEVELEAVQARLGVTFTAEQLADAGVLIPIEPPQETT